jgi:leucyl aminopeptidase (aminopeptidase T)
MLPSYPESTRRKLARNVLHRTLHMKRGENLIIETWTATLPWAESLVLEARIIGVRTLLSLEDEPTYWKSVDLASSSNLGHVGAHELAALKEADAYIYLSGPFDTAREEALPQNLERRLHTIDHEWMRISQKYGVRCVRWDLGRTSTLRARRYGLDLAQWRNELIEATAFDSHILRRDGRRVAAALRRGNELTVAHPNGTQLTLRLARRRPIVQDGVVDESDVRSGLGIVVVPGGATIVSVDETYSEGRFVSNCPGVMFLQQKEFPLGQGTWTFRGGRLTDYSFERGGGQFLRTFPKLGAGKDRAGLISIGLNPRITSIPLLFDQERGRFSLAIGRNSYYGGANRSPHFTAYQSLRGATVQVDGKDIVRAGNLT